MPTEPSTNFSDATRYVPEVDATKAEPEPVQHAAMSTEAESAFNDILFPPDSYENGYVLGRSPYR